MIDYRKLEVWFLTGSQHLYGPEVLKQVEGDSKKIVKGLHDAGLPVKIVMKPVLTTPQAIADVCLEANSAANCIGLMTWMHTFSPAKMWIAGLTALNKPLAHLHTQFNRDIPWSSIDMDFMNLQPVGAWGSGVRVHVQSPAAEPEGDRRPLAGPRRCQARLGVWMRAAAAWHDARTAKIARIGDNMREVAVTEGDKVEAQMRAGLQRQRIRHRRPGAVCRGRDRPPDQAVMCGL